MMNQLAKLIDSAKNQLPQAFSVTQRSPWPEEVNEVVGYKFLPLPGDMYREIPSPFGDEPLKTEEVQELETELREEGFETLALYLSFHQRLLNGQWGIFLLGEPMWRLREKIRRDLNTSLIEADILSQELVLSHEIYHFRVDLYTLHQELLLRKPLYIPYVNNVYQAVWCTSNCYEESLANCSALDAARGLVRRRAGFAGNITGNWYPYVKGFCVAQPPGYRDFCWPRPALKKGLGGQIYFTQPKEVLDEPQAQWVGLCPTHLCKECPVYLVRRTSASHNGLQLIVKASGDVWVIHRYDPDPFPSRPHAHNRQTGEKLDLGTGDIFDPRTRSYKGRLNDSALRQIRDELSKKWPDVVLPS